MAATALQASRASYSQPTSRDRPDAHGLGVSRQRLAPCCTVPPTAAEGVHTVAHAHRLR